MLIFGFTPKPFHVARSANERSWLTWLLQIIVVWLDPIFIWWIWCLFKNACSTSSASQRWDLWRTIIFIISDHLWVFGSSVRREMFRDIKVIIRPFERRQSASSTQIVSTCAIFLIWSKSTPLLVFNHQIWIVTLFITLHDCLIVAANRSILIWIDDQLTWISLVIYQVLEFGLILRKWLVVLWNGRLIDSLLRLSNECFSRSLIRFSIGPIWLLSIIFIRSLFHLIHDSLALFVSEGWLALSVTLPWDIWLVIVWDISRQVCFVQLICLWGSIRSGLAPACSFIFRFTHLRRWFDHTVQFAIYNLILGLLWVFGIGSAPRLLIAPSIDLLIWKSDVGIRRLVRLLRFLFLNILNRLPSLMSIINPQISLILKFLFSNTFSHSHSWR